MINNNQKSIKMAKLIFEIKGDERKWPVMLNDFMGETLVEESIVEYDATAKKHIARVHLMNFKNNPEFLNKLTDSESIISAYMIDNKKITKHIR